MDLTFFRPQNEPCFNKLLLFLFFFRHIRLATEIRCQEKSKGGLSYEVILGQPVTVPPLKQNKQLPSAKQVSVAEIERKLCEAEKRRLVRMHLFFMQMKYSNFTLNMN